METIISEIARNRMEKDVNDALNTYGLMVTGIRFDATEGFSVIIELGTNENSQVCLSC